ncbi:hypothetical protein C0991_004484 [Blastosporella zonata]|nr:hypothetical protein C0991_004484 [Blastosporella zonata]
MSRILKCLSEFGFEHLSVGFLLHVLWEQSENNELNTPGIRSSMDRWWANCLRDDGKRKGVGGLIRKVRDGEDGYVFTRDTYKDELPRLRGINVGGVVNEPNGASVATGNAEEPPEDAKKLDDVAETSETAAAL